MSYAALGRLESQARWDRRIEEENNPKILKKWKAVAPTVVDMGVHAASGSHVAGKAARLAVESSPKAITFAAEMTRDLAYQVGTDIFCTVVGVPMVLIGLPVIAIHDAFVEKKKRWVFGAD